MDLTKLLLLSITVCTTVAAIALPTGWQSTNPAVTAKYLFYASYGGGSWGFLAGSQYQLVPEFIITDDFMNFETATLTSLQTDLPYGGVAYGSAGWMVAVNSTYALSKDGVNWQQYTLNSNCYLGQLTYGNGYYLIGNGAGAGGTIEYCYSMDGVTWTSMTVTGVLSYEGYQFTFIGDTLWLYGFNGNQIASSTDLQKWNFQTVTGLNGVVIWMNMDDSGTLTAIGFDDISTNLYLFSFDSTSNTWTQLGSYTTMSSEDFEFTYGKGMYVFYSGYFWLGTSDFKTFVNVSVPWDDDIFAEPNVMFLNDRFVSFGADGEIATSMDGKEWTMATEGLIGNVYTSFYFNNQFVVTSSLDTYYYPGIYTSPDAITWTQVSSTTTAQDLQWVPSLSKFVGSNFEGLILSSSLSGPYDMIDVPSQVGSWAVGNGLFMVQYNGQEGMEATIYVGSTSGQNGWQLSWSAVSPCPPCQKEYVSNIVFFEPEGLFYVANIVNGTLMTSGDGKAWDVVMPPSACSDPTRIFIAGDYLYLSCGDGNVLLASSGSSAWQLSNLVAFFYDLEYLDDLQLYVATGDAGTVWYSTDGLEFTQGENIYNGPDPVSFYSVTAGNGKILAIGCFTGNTWGNLIYEAEYTK